MKNRLLRILVAFDIFVFSLLTLGNAQRNETISAAAWSLEQDGRLQGRIFRPLIDFLLRWMEPDHCFRSWRTEHYLRNLTGTHCK